MSTVSVIQSVSNSDRDSRELKQRKFSGRRRLEWQREAGTDVAVASRQIQLFKRQVHSDGDGVAFQRKK